MKNLEKLSLSTLFCASALWSAGLLAQTVTTPSGKTAQKRLHLHFISGYNTFKLGEVKDFYGAVVNEYRLAKVPIPTQREFPGNLLLGFEALYHLPSGFNLGLGLRYSWTRAFSLYGDYAGELDVNAKVEMLAIEGIFEKELSGNKLFQPCLGIRGGWLTGWSEFTEKINFRELPQLNESTILSGHGNNFSIEGFVGTKYHLSSLVLSARAGYRYAKISSIDGKLSINNISLGSGKIPLELDFSGVVFALGIGIVIGH
jgi:hypothetical protein